MTIFFGFAGAFYTTYNGVTYSPLLLVLTLSALINIQSLRISLHGGGEAALIARTLFCLVMFRECGELLYGERFFLMLKRDVYKRYIRPAILYEIDVGCLREKSQVDIQCSGSILH